MCVLHLPRCHGNWLYSESESVTVAAVCHDGSVRERTNAREENNSINSTTRAALTNNNNKNIFN